jgi:hypothetical protein
MQTNQEHFDRLTLLVQRILDADVLCDAEGDALLAEIDVARRSREIGDTESVRRHLNQVIRFSDALADNDLLITADSRAILEIAHCILDEAAE